MEKEKTKEWSWTSSHYENNVSLTLKERKEFGDFDLVVESTTGVDDEVSCKLTTTIALSPDDIECIVSTLMCGLSSLFSDESLDDEDVCGGCDDCNCVVPVTAQRNESLSYNNVYDYRQVINLSQAELSAIVEKYLRGLRAFGVKQFTFEQLLSGIIGEVYDESLDALRSVVGKILKANGFDRVRETTPDGKRVSVYVLTETDTNEVLSSIINAGEESPLTDIGLTKLNELGLFSSLRANDGWKCQYTSCPVCNDV